MNSAKYKFFLLSVSFVMTIMIGGLLFTFGTMPAIAESTTGEGIILPSSEEIIADLKAQHSNKNHPRLMGTGVDFQTIKANVQTDQTAARMLEQLELRVLDSLHDPLPVFETPDGLRLPASDNVLASVRALAMMYRIDGDTKYADRAWDILQSAGNFPNWNPKHFLDVATMTQAFAIGYDWLYDAWTNSQKQFIRQAIVEKGLEPALAVYRGEAPGNWHLLSHNWNTVVNSGIGIGALAIADESPALEQLAGEVLEAGFRSIQLVLPTFAPDGGGHEGVGYWVYNTSNLVYYAASLRSALGTDYGLTDAPGIAGTVYYPIYMGGPQGSFNYADSGPQLVSHPIFLWFAKRFDDPGLANYHLSQLKNKQVEALDLLWYRPNMVDAPVHWELDKRFANIEVGSMRSSWNDPFAIFVGFKGGDNGFNHSNLDLGSFVLDALGVRWARDLGADNYNLPGYFDMSGPRWDYYRMRAEGQNTLVFDASDKPGQTLDAKASITKEESIADQAYMIADLSDGYADKADEVLRGIMLFDHRRQLLIQDEIKLKQPGEFHWFMHTAAKIEISNDGKTAILTDGDKQLLARILTDDTRISFRIRQSEPMAFSPDPAGQGNNEFPKLEVYGDNIDVLRLSILLVPLMRWEAPPEQLPSVVPLSNWQLPSTEIATLTNLQMNGSTLPDFSAHKYTYYIDVDNQAAVPTVIASAAVNNDQITIDYPDQTPGVIRIKVTASDVTRRDAEYRIYLRTPYMTDEIVVASSHDGNIPQNTLDNNLDTRWSAAGMGQWIQYRLDRKRLIDQVDIAFYNGHVRSTFFDILVSEDGMQWQQVYSGSSSGTTSGYETFAFDEVLAQYVRIVTNGNTLNEWNSISEVTIEGLQKGIIEDSERLAELALVADRDYLQLGSTLALQLAGVMQDGSAFIPEQAVIRYKTSNPLIATVSSDGVVQAIGYGTVKVAAEVLLNHRIYDAVMQLEVTDGHIYVRVSGDTYVQGGANANQNYGTSSMLVIKNDSSAAYRREGYMQFQLPAINEPILSAKLYMNAAVQDVNEKEANLGIFLVEDDWSERALTWNTKPAIGELLATARITDTRQWHALDLSSYVQQQLNTGKPINIALLQHDDKAGVGIYVKSREDTDQPYLQIKTASMAVQVSAITVTADRPDRSSFIDESIQMQADIIPVDAYNKQVKWRVEHGTGEAVIDEVTGWMTGMKAGTVTIIAEAKDNSGISGSLEWIIKPTTYLLEPSDDAYVQGGTNATNNFGKHAQLLAKEDSSASYSRQSFMMFDLSSVVGSIDSATLYLYGAVSDSAGQQATLGIYRAEGAWTEAAINWHSKPQLTELLQTKQLDDIYRWYEVDVTTYVQQQQMLQEKVNLGLQQSMGTQGLLITVHSREGLHKPYLKITTKADVSSITE